MRHWRQILSWRLPEKTVMKITFHASYDTISNYYNEDPVEFMSVKESDVEDTFPSYSGAYHIVGSGVFDAADSIHASVYVSVPYDAVDSFREAWQQKDVEVFGSMIEASTDYRKRKWDNFSISDPSLIKDFND